MRNLLLLLLVALLALPACKNNHVAHSGIQKRKYTKGYHVSLGKRNRKALAPAIVNQPVTVLEEETVPEKEEEPLLAVLDEPQTPDAKSQQLPGIVVKQSSLKQMRVQVEELVNQRFHPSDSLEAQKEEPSKGAAIVGFFLEIGGLVMSITGNVIQAVSFTYSASLYAIALLGSLAFLTGWIICIVMFALNRIEPENYGGRGWATAGMITGIALLVIGILFLIVYVVLLAALFV